MGTWWIPLDKNTVLEIERQDFFKIYAGEGGTFLSMIFLTTLMVILI